MKPWRERSRTCRTTFSRRRAVFLIGATRHDPQSVIRQWPLQGLGLVPRRAHPHIAFFVGRQDYRHRLEMDRFDDRIGRGGQKAVNKVRSGDRLRLGPAVTFEFGSESPESEQGPVAVQGEPHDTFLAGRRVGLRRIFGEAVGRYQNSGSPASASRASVVMWCYGYWPPVRGGGGMPQRIMTSSRSAPALRATGAG